MDKLIAVYNTWVNGQIKAFNKVKTDCPYYRVDKGIINNLNEEQEKQLKKFSTNSKPYELWSKIFKNISRPPGSRIKKVKGLNFKINNYIFKLIDADALLSFSRSNGLFIPRDHFEWMLTNKLLKPFKVEKGKKLFSKYQLLVLDKIDRYKKMSLGHPNPRVYAEKHSDTLTLIDTITYNWKEFILNNRNSILDDYEDIDNLICLLEALNKLDIEILGAADLDFNKIKSTNKNNNFAALDDIYNVKREKAYRYYYESIKKKFRMVPPDHIKRWAFSTFPVLAIGHNPVLQLATKLPSILSLLKKHENLTDTILKKGNEIKLANFYINLIKQLTFFVRASKKNHKNVGIEELLSQSSINKQKICLICNEFFEPNLKRKGGRKQIICLGNECQRKWRKERQKEYRVRIKSK